MTTQTYNLNLIPGGSPVRVPVSQYDAGSRDIIFSLYSGSAAFSLPAGATVTVDGTKPDRKGFSYVTAASGNTVTVTVTKQMTAVPGNAECQLTVMQSGKVLGSANFLLAVERAALPDEADLSESEVSSIETWKNQSLLAAETAEQSRKQAADSAAAAKVSADNADNHTHSADKITSGTLSTARLPTVPISKGGLGKTSWVANRLPYPSGSSAFSQLPFPTAAGSFLRQNTSGAPYWTAPSELRNAIDAAPGGYGLGEEPVPQSSLDQMSLPGFYRLTGSHTIPPISVFGDDVAVVLVERAGIHIKQTVTLTSGSGRAIRWGTQTGGELTFQDWEWETPPMSLGMEFRTTERRDGSAVYTKIVDCGTLPNNTRKMVNHGATASAVIRCSGIQSTKETIPYHYGANTHLYLSANMVYIILFSTYDASSWTGQVQIWYTKD